MVKIWRQFVVWLRKLLVKIYRKDTIEWDKEITVITDIAKEAIDKKKPAVKSKIPSYDMTGDIPRPRRRLLDLLSRR